MQHIGEKLRMISAHAHQMLETVLAVIQLFLKRREGDAVHQQEASV